VVLECFHRVAPSYAEFMPRVRPLTGLAAVNERLRETAATHGTNQPPRELCTIMSDGGLYVDGKEFDIAAVGLERTAEILQALFAWLKASSEVMAEDVEARQRRLEQERARDARRRPPHGSVKTLIEEAIMSLPPNPQPIAIRAAIRDRYTEQQLIEIIGRATITNSAIRVALCRWRKRLADR
jgi:hypothetical protein